MNALQQVNLMCDFSPARVINTGFPLAYLSEALMDGNTVETPRNRQQTESTAARKTARHGDIAVRDRIVLENLSLVKSIAARVHSGLPVHVDLEDLTHAGVMGLID